MQAATRWRMRRTPLLVTPGREAWMRRRLRWRRAGEADVADTGVTRPPFGLRPSCVFPIGAKSRRGLQQVLMQCCAGLHMLEVDGRGGLTALVIVPHSTVTQDEDW